MVRIEKCRSRRRATQLTRAAPVITCTPNDELASVLNALASQPYDVLGHVDIRDGTEGSFRTITELMLSTAGLLRNLSIM